jgi:hypothetical protein
VYFPRVTPNLAHIGSGPFDHRRMGSNERRNNNN